MREQYLEILLSLGQHTQIELLLDAGLAAVTTQCQASLAYVELYFEPDVNGAPVWSRAINCSEQAIAHIRGVLSGGIMQHAIEHRETVRTPDAFRDERFQDLGSVRQHEIGAVVCAPIWLEDIIGVLYVQARRSGGEFSAEDARSAELAAQQLGLVARRLFLERGRASGDLAADVEELKRARAREAMAQCDNNVSAAAKMLGVTRTTIYRLTATKPR